MDESRTTVSTSTSPVHDRNRVLKAEWDSHIAAFGKATAEGDLEAAAEHDAAAKAVMAQFFNANSGLAYAAARVYLVASERENHDDYINAAFVGLLEAFPMWNPDKGTFATFSRPYAEGVVRRTVRLYTRPEISYGDYSQAPAIAIAEAKLRATLDRHPSDKEIADATGISVGIVSRVRRQRPVSLDVPVGDGEQTRGDLVGAEDDDVVEASVGGSIELTEEQEEALLEALAELTPTQRVVAARRHGLDGAPPQTLAEIGELIDSSREAMRRAEAKAHEALLHLLG